MILPFVAFLTVLPFFPKTMDKVTIREETPADYDAVMVMVREAFWNLYAKGCDEHYLVHRMHSHADRIPELTLVAVQQREGDDDDNDTPTTILGYIGATRSMIGNTECVTIAPLAVSRSCQGNGIGARLVEAVVAKCKSSSSVTTVSFPCIALQGYPSYYARLGFENAQKFGVHMPDKSQPLGLQILPISSSHVVPRGAYVESSLFHEEIDPEVIEAFEAENKALFPYKETKEGTRSQKMFAMIIPLAHDDELPPEFDPKACNDPN
jgi:predicted N-acetyltransferase YhbS